MEAGLQTRSGQFECLVLDGHTHGQHQRQNKHSDQSVQDLFALGIYASFAEEQAECQRNTDAESGKTGPADCHAAQHFATCYLTLA